jgi:hypothetical protein
VVERASLERMYTGNRIGGSNPPLSASTENCLKRQFSYVRARGGDSNRVAAKPAVVAKQRRGPRRVGVERMRFYKRSDRKSMRVTESQCPAALLWGGEKHSDVAKQQASWGSEHLVNLVPKVNKYT